MFGASLQQTQSMQNRWTNRRGVLRSKFNVARLNKFWIPSQRWWLLKNVVITQAVCMCMCEFPSKGRLVHYFASSSSHHGRVQVFSRELWRNKWLHGCYRGKTLNQMYVIGATLIIPVHCVEYRLPWCFNQVKRALDSTYFVNPLSLLGSTPHSCAC